MTDWTNSEDEPIRKSESPPPLAPLNRAAELLEALFVREPGFVGELLGILRHFDGATLQAIFGSPVTSPQVPPVATAAAVHEPAGETPPGVPTEAEPAPAPSQPVTAYEAECAKMLAAVETLRHDERGHRTDKAKSTFPRQPRVPQGRPPGATWLSD